VINSFSYLVYQGYLGSFNNLLNKNGLYSYFQKCSDKRRSLIQFSINSNIEISEKIINYLLSTRKSKRLSNLKYCSSCIMIIKIKTILMIFLFLHNLMSRYRRQKHAYSIWLRRKNAKPRLHPP